MEPMRPALPRMLALLLKLRYQYQNTVVSIALEGLVQRSDGSPVTACLQRNMVQLSPVRALLRPSRHWMVRPDNGTPRPPSTLPPPGYVQLTLKLGSFLGDGRSGIVFDVEQLAAASLSQNDVSHYSFPPLVVKVARSTRCMSMAREAWFYDHLECLQGVVMPRCYAWFELQLPRGCVVPAWTTYPSDDIETDAEEGPAEFMDYHPDRLREANVAPIPFMTELASMRDRLFILVLGRVGDELERSPTLKDDLWNAYRELAHMSINMARDVKYNNILMAPKSPPGLPSLPSPFTQRTHNIRIVDSELALKTIFTDDIIMSSCKGYFSGVIHSC